MSVEQKLDRIIELCNDLEVHQAEMRKDLAYHIKRTDALEAIVMDHKAEFELFEDEKFRSVEKHIAVEKVLIRVVSWVIGTFATIAGLAFTLSRFI